MDAPSVRLLRIKTYAEAYTDSYGFGKRRATKTYITWRNIYGCVVSGYGRSRTVSRESAGAAIRELREARDWSLADFASVTGVSIMGLSYLERGARKPHKSTVQKVENGLGLPPGTYSRLLVG